MKKTLLLSAAAITFWWTLTAHAFQCDGPCGPTSPPPPATGEQSTGRSTNGAFRGAGTNQFGPVIQQVIEQQGGPLLPLQFFMSNQLPATATPQQLALLTPMQWHTICMAQIMMSYRSEFAQSHLYFALQISRGLQLPLSTVYTALRQPWHCQMLVKKRRIYQQQQQSSPPVGSNWQPCRPGALFTGGGQREVMQCNQEGQIHPQR